MLTTVAECWIDFFGRFGHIRYFAVCDDGNRYSDTLEVAQDLKRVRSLEGERRLLQFADGAMEEVYAQ